MPKWKRKTSSEAQLNSALGSASASLIEKPLSTSRSSLCTPKPEPGQTDLQKEHQKKLNSFVSLSFSTHLEQFTGCTRRLELLLRVWLLPIEMTLTLEKAVAGFLIIWTIDVIVVLLYTLLAKA